MGRMTVTWENTAKHLWKAMALLYVALIVGGYFLWHAYSAIQDSRENATYDACQDANDRWHGFVRGLDAEIHRLPEAQRTQAEQQKASTLRLVGTFLVVHEKPVKGPNGKLRVVSTCRVYAQQRTR